MSKFGKFQLLEKIGEGGMAEVFVARPSDVELSKLVAVKRILPKHLHDPAFEEMFKREGEIALRFRHPGIITVYEMGSIDGLLFMTMEYFPGKPLSHVINELRSNPNTISAVDKILIIRSIVDALRYIHNFTEHGERTEFIHRDISPANIMIGFNGETKLIDFGIARDVSNQSEIKSIKGKLSYLSPEQIRGDTLTRQTDIFSLGIVFWEVLAERKLFTGKSITEVTDKILANRVPSLTSIMPDIPVELDQMLSKALAHELTDRYRSAGELCADIDRFLRAASVEEHHHELAKAMHKLFPQDAAKLKKILKKFEGQQERGSGPQTGSQTSPAPKPSTVETVITGPSSGSPAVPVASIPASMVATNVVPSSRSVKKESETRPKVAHSPEKAQLRRRAIVAAVMVVLVGSMKLVRVVFPKQEVETVKVVVTREVAAVADAPVPPIATPYPTPYATPFSTPLPLPPTPYPTPAPSASRPLQPRPQAKPVTKPRPPPVRRVESTPARVPKPTAQPKNVTVVQPASEVTPSRKPSNVPLGSAVPMPFAYLTVLADPNARILIDGKEVGVEVLDEIKVPADQVMTVKVIFASSNRESIRKIKFKPLSRNVLEISASQPSGD